jgi:5S rRNA maturation endonuclease (ribonuclease M5)
MRYLRIPRCVVTESTAQWSLANMTSSEVRMYVALCWLANNHSDHQFTTSASEMRELTGFSTPAIQQKALEGLESKALVSVSTTPGGTHIHLLDPYSGEPLYNETLDPIDDPANYFSADSRGRESRLNLNDSDPEQIRSLVISRLPHDRAEVINQGNGDFKINCPFHEDRTPSCSVSPTKRTFHCFGCNQKGHLTKLLQKLTGESKGQVIQRMGQAQGKDVRYHDPDANAETIYSYSDKNGKLVKQVIRYPAKEFRQRRPGRGGTWVWDTNGIKPLLYNLNELEFAATCILCEGEKDCETLEKMQLSDLSGAEVIATTSGGADSWSDELAESLFHKRVILMPDNDEAGRRFESKVIASLQDRRIECRVVRFEDVGANDVTEFIELGYGRSELADRIGTDWVSGGTPSPAADEVTVTI